MAAFGQIRWPVAILLNLLKCVLLSLSLTRHSGSYQPRGQGSSVSLRLVQSIPRIGVLCLRGGSDSRVDNSENKSEADQRMDTEDEHQCSPEDAWSGERKPWGDCGAIPGMYADEALKKVKVISCQLENFALNNVSV